MLSVTERLADKYALAIFSLAEEQNSVDAIYNRLLEIKNVFADNSELHGFINNPLVPKKSKKEVLQTVFAGNIEDILLNFILVLVDKNRIALYDVICKAYLGLLNERNGILEVKVTTARPLSAEQEDQVKNKVGRLLNKDIVLNKRVDSKIMGGIIIQIGDKLVDGSIARRLNDIGRSIKSIDMREIGVTK